MKQHQINEPEREKSIYVMSMLMYVMSSLENVHKNGLILIR